MPFAFALRPALRLTGFALLATLSPALFAQSGSAVADGFNPNVTDGNVYALAVQPDARFVIAGDFQHLQPNGGATIYEHHSIARINPDGSTDETFKPDVNGRIWALALQNDGSMVIGGEFTTVNGTTRNRVARLKPDGELDATFDPNTGGSLTPEVLVVMVQGDGGILIGGGFTTVRPSGAATATTRNRIARFNADGTLDTSFDPNANNTVLALAQADDGSLYIGGGFTTIGGQPQLRVAHLSLAGTCDAGFHPNPTGSIHAIAPQHNGTVIIGGNFLLVQPDPTVNAVSKAYLLRVKADGSSDGTFLGTTNGPVLALKNMADGSTLVSGTIGPGASGTTSYAARLQSDGYSDGVFAPSPNAAVYAFGVQTDGSVVMAGSFTAVAGSGVNSLVRNHVVRITPQGAPDTDFRPDVNGRLQTLVRQSDGKLLVGGTFTSVAGKTHQELVRLNSDGSVDDAFAPDVSGTVSVIAQQSDGKILIGGSFVRVSGISRPYIARLNADGTLDTAFDPIPNNLITAIAVQPDGKIVLSGNFSVIQPHGTTDVTTRNYFARLNADGTLDTTFDPNSNAAADSIVVQSDGKILLGGAFTSFAPNGASSGTTRYGMARLNTDGTLDSGFNPNVNGTVLTMAVQSDGAVVFGGLFQQLAPNTSNTATTRSNIARVTSAGDLDTGFDPSVNGMVLSVAIQSDGKILVGGHFTALQPNGGATVNAYDLARINSDGTVDSSFDVKLDQLPGNEVRGFVFSDDSHVMIGGSFSMVTHGSNSFVNNRLVRVALDGTIDPTFRSDAAAAGGASIEAIALERNGRILVGGTFDSIGGASGTNLAEFQSDGIATLGFSPTVDGPVHAVAQLTNKGQAIDTQAPGFAWFESNGGLRSDFAFPASLVAIGSVRNVEVQSDGKLLVAGSIAVDLTPGDASDDWASVALARFNPDGSLDSSFKPLDFDSGTYSVTVVATLTQPDGKILVAGAFSTVVLRSTAVSNLIRLNADGSLDTTFTPAPDSTVYALALQPDGKILIGGDFSSVKPDPNTDTISRSGIARLNADGTVDTSFDPKANNSVYTIYLKPDGKILAGGVFTTMQPNGASAATTRNHIAELNADGTLTSQDFNASNVVSTIVPQADGKILVGGYFTSIAGTSRNYIARLNSDNTLDTAFNPNPNGGVPAIAVFPDGKIVIGGPFTALQPNGSSTYDSATATPRAHIARLNPDGTIDASFNPTLDSDVARVIAYPDGTIIATGGFSVTQPTGSIVIGGTFSYINGIAVQNLALFSNDGSISSTLQPNPDGGVYALLPLSDDRLILAGAFTTLAGATRNRIARFNADNSLDQSYNPNADDAVYVAVLQADGKVVVGGAFATIGGVAHAHLARLNVDGTVDSSFNAGIAGAVHGLAIQNDGKILVLADGAGVHSVLSRVDSSGNADASFTAVNGGADAINTIALQTDGKIVVGGAFTTIAGTSHPYLARLNGNGTLDASLTAQPNGAVTAITLQPDGKIVLAGAFSTVDGLPRFGLARIAASAPPVSTFTLASDRASATWIRSGSAPEVTAVSVETSSDGIDWTTLGQATRIAGTPNWRISGLNYSTGDSLYLRVRALLPSSPGASAGVIEDRGYFPLDLTPVITSATVVSATTGTDFIYAIAGTGQPTTFTATGLPAGLAFDSASGLISGQPTQTGTFDVTIGAGNSSGAGPTSVLRIVVTATIPTPPTISRLVNISINGQVTGTDRIIGGFVIRGDTPQSLLLRAVGPTLTHFGVASFVPQPHLRVFNSAGHILIDKAGWTDSDALRNVTAATGASPLDPGSLDAAVLATLPPGAYTMHVLDDSGTGGTALAEIYDASVVPTDTPRLINISGRSVVNASGTVAIGGFVINGDLPKRVLVRGVGPGLTAQGVTNALSDPTITLFKIGAPNTIVASNDNWETPVTVDSKYPAVSGSELAASASTAGAFALTSGSKDAALIVTLAPGIYTVQVRSGVKDGAGSVLAEVYELP